MKDNNYEYLSTSAYTAPTFDSSFRKGSGQFTSFDTNRINAKASPNSLGTYKKQWSANLPSSSFQLSSEIPANDNYNSNFGNSNDYRDVKRLPDDISNLRATFDTRSNNRIRDMISKYDDGAADTKYETGKNGSKYDKSDNNFTGSKVTGDKDRFRNMQLEDKLKKYSSTVDQFSNQLQNTNKMSEQIRKLKEDRRKRLQAKQKQPSDYPITSSYSSANLGTTYKSPTSKGVYEDYQFKKYEYKQPEAFKKKKSYQVQASYTPKYEKKYYQQPATAGKVPSSPTDGASFLDKYKTKTKLQQPIYTSTPATTSSKYDKYDKYDKYNVSSPTSIPTSVPTTSSYSIKSVSSPTSKKISDPVKYVEVNNFILGKSLGQGKFGIVYQATHKQTRCLFAIKKIPKDMIRSHLMIDQFILELKLQTYLYHQNLLTLFTHFDDKQSIYLVLQYMEEGTLFAHLKKNKTLPQAQVAVKIKQIASAVKYLHENQIAHRDIKPENIVMSHGVCKLCDFGWATICDSRRKTYCGTFDYAPPEILQGSEYDYTVDLWCLGVLTYELLVGKAPFYHISRKQTMKKILNVQFTTLEYPETLSKNAINFIDSLIKKDPKERLSSDMLLEHPFLKYADKPTTKFH